MIESGISGAIVNFWRAVDDRRNAKTERRSADAAVKSALANPAVQRRLETLGQVIFPPEQQGPAALAAYHKAEIDKWWPNIRAAGIKAE
jgi:tripartite-type tricarboxylate transporter receptor subunit TctC